MCAGIGSGLTRSNRPLGLGDRSASTARDLDHPTDPAGSSTANANKDSHVLRKDPGQGEMPVSQALALIAGNVPARSTFAWQRCVT